MTSILHATAQDILETMGIFESLNDDGRVQQWRVDRCGNELRARSIHSRDEREICVTIVRIDRIVISSTKWTRRHVAESFLAQCVGALTSLGIDKTATGGWSTRPIVIGCR